MSHGAPASGTTIDSAAFKEVMGCFATGVAIVTASHHQGPVGFTCQSFVPLSLEPALIALAPAKTSTSWPLIREAGSFCVNILASSQAQLCSAFARSGGEKFGGVFWATGASGAPLLDGAIAHIECELELAHDAGDHELIIGRVISLSCSPGEPLLFFRSQFTTTANPKEQA